MVDWNGVDADVNVWINTHFTTGREGRTINKLIVHHNAGVNLSTQDCANIWQTREASAHYQVESNGRIGQLVHDWDTSWNAGDWEANLTSIGIEHANSGGAAQGWPISEATRENGAHLVAALCKRYGLGRPEWGKNVFPHQHFQSTACPGKLYGEYKDSYIKRAQEWYDSMTGSTPEPVPSPAPAPAPKPSGKLDVDGFLGKDTWNKWAAVYGNSGGGVISSQDSYWKNRVPGITCAEWVPSGSAAGSIHIATMQRDYAKKGLYSGDFDGLIGPKFISAFLRDNRSTDDGIISEQSLAVMNLQRWLNTK